MWMCVSPLDRVNSENRTNTLHWLDVDEFKDGLILAQDVLVSASFPDVKCQQISTQTYTNSYGQQNKNELNKWGHQRRYVKLLGRQKRGEE